MSECPGNGCDCPEPEPLTPDERRWLRRFERVLKDMPERVKLVESGHFLVLVDRAAASQHELHDGKSSGAAVWLADVKHSLFKVTGVSG